MMPTPVTGSLTDRHEDGIGAHGRLAFAVLIADRSEACQMAVARYEGHDARGRSAIDKGLHARMNQRPPRRVHSRLGWIGGAPG
jgi:hypothetical protein